jgi:hypothetical protein
MTESGKTTLARDLAAEYKSAGAAVLVLDPLRDPRWKADYITADPGEFLRVVWNSRSCMLFVDEAGEAVGRYDVAMQSLATRARHWGHCTHFVTQRGAQLSPTVRHQCRYLFLFTSSVQDGELLAREFNQMELENCNRLKQGEYFFTSRFGTLQRKRVQIGDYTDASSSDCGRDNSRLRRDSERLEAAKKGAGSNASASASASAGTGTGTRTGNGVDSGAE